MAKNTGHEEAGIFCLETAMWGQEPGDERPWHEIEDQDSLDHFLRFLETSSKVRIPYRHYDVATAEEFRFYLETWTTKEIRERFPVLLLAFHGNDQGLYMVKDDEVVPTNELRGYLSKDEKSDNDAIIHFSSCYFSPDKMGKLLEDTGALSVSGYMKGRGKGVGWYQSAAFELLFLAELFGFVSSETGKRGPPEGTDSMRKFAKENYAKNQALVDLGNEVEFQLWYDVRDASKANPKGLPEGIEPHRQKP